MSSSSNSTSSSLNRSTTSNPQDGSGRTFTSSFTGQFGSMSPVYNPDGSLKGVYDQGKFHPSGRSRNSVSILGASPALVNASSSRPPPPSSIGNMAGGVSVSRSLRSEGGILSQRILQQQGGRADYPMYLHHKEATMQSQQSSMGKHGGFYSGGASTSHYPPQLQHAQAVSSGGISSQTGGPLGIGLRSLNAAMGYDQPLHQHQNTSQYQGQKMSPIGQPFGDVGTKPMQEPQSAPDPFCMLGLLDVINNSNPDLTTLALGLDLKTLGLDLTSKKDLFKTFASPWANEPLEDDFDEFIIPQCYNEIQQPPPHQGMFRFFKVETLFYIFYSMPKDEAQLYAADELYNRDWFYHKEVKWWFIRNGEPLLKTDEYESGTYGCFDPEKFEFVQYEDIFIHYEMLEKRPPLPQHRV